MAFGYVFYESKEARLFSILKIKREQIVVEGE